MRADKRGEAIAVEADRCCSVEAQGRLEVCGIVEAPQKGQKGGPVFAGKSPCTRSTGSPMKTRPTHAAPNQAEHVFPYLYLLN